MKIAITVTSLKQGGITTALLALLKELARNKDLKVTLILFCKTNSSRFSIPEGIEVIYPSWLLSKWWDAKDETMSGLWFKCLRALSYRTTQRPIVWLATRGKSIGKFDVAIAFEDDSAKPYANFMCNDFVLHRIDSVRKLSWVHNDPYRLGFTAEFIKKRYKEFEGVVNVSKACKTKFDAIYPAYASKSYVVYNCVNRDEMISSVYHGRRAAAGQGDAVCERRNRFRIVSISRIFNIQKRIDRIIEACRILKEDGYTEKIRWELYGSGPDEEEMKKTSEKFGVTNILIFKGRTEKPLEIMRCSDLFVMSSDYEAYGLTLLEAQMAELPIIVTNFEEAYELVRDGKSGFIVEKSARAIADKIEYLLEHREVLERMRNYISENPITNDMALKQFYEVIGYAG